MFPRLTRVRRSPSKVDETSSSSSPTAMTTAAPANGSSSVWAARTDSAPS